MTTYNKQHSKRVSWLLRHGATHAGLVMDEAGWVDVASVLAQLHLSAEQLRAVVDHNDKRRIEWVGDRIRACQGHSKDNRAVTLEGLEGSWSRYPQPRMWHGTTVDAALAIARTAIEPIDRTHVHCAPTPDSIVGKRSGVAVLLEIDVAAVRTAGYEVFQAANGVVLARRVPPPCIVAFEPRTRAAREARGVLQDAFGL